MLPAAAAFEHPDRVVAQATAYFEGLGARVHRAPGAEPPRRRGRRQRLGGAGRRFVYLADGSPLHLRSVLKEQRVLRGDGLRATAGAR